MEKLSKTRLPKILVLMLMDQRDNQGAYQKVEAGDWVQGCYITCGEHGLRPTVEINKVRLKSAISEAETLAKEEYSLTLVKIQTDTRYETIALKIGMLDDKDYILSDIERKKDLIGNIEDKIDLVIEGASKNHILSSKDVKQLE